MTPLSALSMMVFVLLYLPCLATTTSIRRETGSYRWMFFSIGYSTSLALAMAFVVYQGWTPTRLQLNDAVWPAFSTSLGH